MLPCHVVLSMLMWLYMRFRSALFCNGAAPQCGWSGLMLKLCCVGWRKKRAACSVACLAPVFSRRIVLIKKCTIRRVLIATWSAFSLALGLYQRYRRRLPRLNIPQAIHA